MPHTFRTPAPIVREIIHGNHIRAEYNFREDKKTPGVRSENIDGYSVSYGDSTETSRSADSAFFSNAGKDGSGMAVPKKALA